MRIRTQFLLAFLLLAVLPLVGIVGFSYVGSQRAIRRAAVAEAAQLSAEMDERLTAARQSLRSRVEELPWSEILSGLDDSREQDLGRRLLEELGDSAPAIDALTFIPSPGPPVPEGLAAPRPPGPPRPPLGASGSSPNRIVLWQEAPGAAAPEDAEAALPPAPPVPSEVFILKPDFLKDGSLEVGRGAGIGDGAADTGAGPPTAVELAAGAEAEAHLKWLRDSRVDSERAKLDLKRELQKLRMATSEQRSRLIFGDPLGVEVRRDGRVIGALQTQVNPERLLARIFSRATRQRGEVPFAIDAKGRLYASSEEDRRKIESLEVGEAKAGTSWRQGEWVVATSADQSTGLRLGVARPVGDALRELRSTALRNLVFGLALIAFAVLGVLPVSRRISDGLRGVAEGAERIARGDLETRLPVRGHGELAHLSRAFNSMVHDLRDHQERLLAEERRRRDQEMSQQLMAAELERQRQELEEARIFQLSLLPQTLPRHDAFELAVHIETATEVGGDYYDFRLSHDGRLTVVIGDATGHGARAGTMVTVIKSLFSAHSTSRIGPGAFLSETARTVRRMDLGRMTMALTVLCLDGPRMVLANAAMPPVLHFRVSTGEVEEILLPGMPLGGLAEEYLERAVDVAAGDTLLLYSDGFPEQCAGDGSPVGYDHVAKVFAGLARDSPKNIAAGLAAAVVELTGGEAPADDVTFVVVRRR